VLCLSPLKILAFFLVCRTIQISVPLSHSKRDGDGDKDIDKDKRQTAARQRIGKEGNKGISLEYGEGERVRVGILLDEELEELDSTLADLCTLILKPHRC
jgi:hypothetical protein